jgi:hypothetical protein
MLLDFHVVVLRIRDDIDIVHHRFGEFGGDVYSDGEYTVQDNGIDILLLYKETVGHKKELNNNTNSYTEQNTCNECTQ